MEHILLPTDVLVEIFSWIKAKYFLFRCLSRDTLEAKIPYDGWDSLVEQGYSAEIRGPKIRWYLLGKLHSIWDLPAVEWPDGTKEWWTNGELHREGDLPSIEYPNTTEVVG